MNFHFTIEGGSKRGEGFDIQKSEFPSLGGGGGGGQVIDNAETNQTKESAPKDGGSVGNSGSSRSVNSGSNSGTSGNSGGGGWISKGNKQTGVDSPLERLRDSSNVQNVL